MLDQGACLRLGRDGQAHEDEAHQHKRDLLQEDSPCRRPEPSAGAARRSAERVDIQDQQHRRQADRHRLEQQGRHEQDERTHEPTPPR